jgi:hypothetical protein
MRTEDHFKRRVALLRSHRSPGVNPYLTRQAWEDMVMALAFTFIEERVRVAADEVKQEIEAGLPARAPRVVDPASIIVAARAEIDRPWVEG